MKNKILFFIYLVGFLSAQRITFPFLSAYICVFPLIIWLVFKYLNYQLFKYDLLIISALASVDLGVGFYTVTPFTIRFIIYLLIIYYSTSRDFRLSKYSFLGLILLSSISIINTIFSVTPIDAYTFFRDILIIYLVAITISKITSIHIFKIEPISIYYFSFGVLTSEVINIIYFFESNSGIYLNLSSLKFVIFVPVIYILSFFKRKYLLIIFIPITFWVLSFYMSRMLVVVCLIVLVISLFSEFKTRYIFLSLIILCAVIYFNYGDLTDILQSNRVLSLFYFLSQENNIFSLLEFLDRVRYIENSYFFGQSLYKILFGSGLGSGIQDPSGVLSFVADDGFSFTSRELDSKMFYVVHDSWLWFGLRFGLVSYLLVLFFGLRFSFSKYCFLRFWALLFLIAFFNSTFSIMGLIVTSIFAKQIFFHIQSKLKDDSSKDSFILKHQN